MSWQEALDHQFDLYRFWGSDDGWRHADTWRRTSIEFHGGEDFECEGLVQLEQSQLVDAEPVHVNEDVFRLFVAAREGFKLETVLPTDPFVERGFVFLPHEVEVTHATIADTSLGYQAFRWCLEPTRVVMTMYRRPGLPRARWCAIGWEAWEFGEVPPSTESAFGNQLRRDIQCFWRLASQTITVPRRLEVSRHARKRAQRIVDVAQPYVTVITLRRAERHGDEGEYARDYTCRWPVSGHWRKQPYSSLGVTRQIWIDDYIKGPDDKPLRIPDRRAFSFSR